MKFKNIGKAVLMGALSAAVVFGVSSCIQSYTVGFLYVTSTATAQPAGNGLITGYKIDHNTGQLIQINGLPISSGGANPVRAVLTGGSRFVYILNRGANQAGDGNCFGTTDPTVCGSSNITQFAVGGNGILTPQQTFFSQGFNPFRLIVDSSGKFLLVLDHDAPDSGVTKMVNGVPTNSCTAALGASNTTCGDITIFSIDQTTGRLSLQINNQVTIGGQNLTFFPVLPNPVDFVLSSSFVLTLTGTTPPTAFPYTGGSTVFPYAYNSTSGQLTLSQNGPQPLGITQGNSIAIGSSVVYVLASDPVTIPSGGSFTAGTYPSQILPFSVGSNGALQAQTGGIIPGYATLANPVQLLLESKGTYLYLAFEGNNVAGSTTATGVGGYQIFNSPSFNLQFIPSFSTQIPSMGSGPQCIVEDPSGQYIYTANQNDSTVSGVNLDPRTGLLNPMRTTSTVQLRGPASWCFIDGRTS